MPKFQNHVADKTYINKKTGRNGAKSRKRVLYDIAMTNCAQYCLTNKILCGILRLVNNSCCLMKDLFTA